MCESWGVGELSVGVERLVGPCRAWPMCGRMSSVKSHVRGSIARAWSACVSGLSVHSSLVRVRECGPRCAER
uniref:Uncharacterized protein n=1 Tax=Manihot esculenta TaxID=3983 RepID=A0A2C9UX59_MANES